MQLSLTPTFFLSLSLSLFEVLQVSHCLGCMCTSQLPEKALPFMGTKRWRSHDAAQSCHLFRVNSLLLANAWILSLLLSSPGSLKWSSNTLHIQLCMSSASEPRLRSQQLDFNIMVSKVTMSACHQSINQSTNQSNKRSRKKYQASGKLWSLYSDTE